MFRFCSVLLLLAGAALSPLGLQAQDKIVLFGGYSFLRPPVTVEETFICPLAITTCPATPPPAFVTSRQNLNGWEVSGAYRFHSYFGIVADVSGHYGPSVSGFSSNAHQTTYLFGPEVSLPSRISPFAHVLFGATHQTISASPAPGALPLSPALYNAIAPANGTGFASALGGGIDLKLFPHFWVRPIQLDYLVTRLHGNNQNQIRVSTGVSFHF